MARVSHRLPGSRSICWRSRSTSVRCIPGFFLRARWSGRDRLCPWKNCSPKAAWNSMNHDKPYIHYIILYNYIYICIFYHYTYIHINIIHIHWYHRSLYSTIYPTIIHVNHAPRNIHPQHTGARLELSQIHHAIHHLCRHPRPSHRWPRQWIDSRDTFTGNSWKP